MQPILEACDLSLDTSSRQVVQNWLRHGPGQQALLRPHFSAYGMLCGIRRSFAVNEGDISAVRAVHHAVRARCIGFPRARTTFSFPLCCFLHLTTICPSLVVSPCAVAAG